MRSYKGASARGYSPPTRRLIMQYEVTNIKTGKSVGIYATEAASRRYFGKDYRITKTDKPANAWPVGFSAL